ncbi:MAG: hypothetical protein CVU44_14610 [Chloroflexi bacterium HGW-Chloroflexi-6]|nr:MAG: hypothetical protein CVU44_14610 [Chloroflexi bacterium HGW-Chloroflexi-6]
MKHNRFFNLFILLALLTVTLGLSATSAAAEDEPGAFVCLPSCDTTDGRMFTISGVGNATLAGQTSFVKIAAPANMAFFQIGIFDGETSGLWDKGTVQLVYTLFADPDGSQTGTVAVGQWNGANMVDNDWFDITIEQDARAQAPGGDYFYYLQIELPEAAITTAQSSFKLRSNSPLELSTNKSFGYMIPLRTLPEVTIIYPDWPALFPTTYDGAWEMYLNVPTSQAAFAIWDGDMDFGSYDCSINDTDDPDTSNDVLPPFAIGISARLEGVATATGLCRDAAGNVITGPEGQVYTTGTPTDDNLSVFYRREPAVTYDVIDPNGNVYHNPNPSGNSEWEQFLITTDRSVLADHYIDSLLPAGIYQVRVTGLDLSNLNAWHLPYDAMGVYEDGTPSVPVLKPFKIGDTIWNDANKNGIQDEGEAGIAGVTVTLLDANGLPNGTAITDENGQYSFGVTFGDYSVQVDSSNFAPGGALAGFSSTTGGELLTDTVTNDNVLTYDFGYRLEQNVNYCGYIRSPGFWKNYKNHMSDAAFLSLVSKTQDFSNLTVKQAAAIIGKNNGKTKIGVPELDGVDARYLKFLLVSQINAVWNGEPKSPALDGTFGSGTYQGIGLTVDQLLHQAYLDRYNFSVEQLDMLNYLGADGEADDMGSCLVQR